MVLASPSRFRQSTSVPNIPKEKLLLTQREPGDSILRVKRPERLITPL